MKSSLKSQDQASKKTYSSPKLQIFGHFKELTLGGGARSVPDGGTRTTKNDN
jgi:hypothetical protein